MAKLIAALLLLLVFLAVFCVILLDHLVAQSLCFAILALIVIYRRGLRHFLIEMKLLMSFTISMLVIYLVFGLFGLRTSSGVPGSVAYWLSFGSTRILLLFNTILFIQTVFSMISYDDLLSLKLGIERSKYLILGKILYDAAFSSHPDIALHHSMIPTEQGGKRSFSRRFASTLTRVLALLYFIISEARLKGEMIDNRILHCHKKEKS
ncbi:MAG: hypothetical protein U1B83_06910 [Candidatus Cloacimonadaceae bacterium]|nr:hypothetical protein [Candidatus Cloacimonadaceae bacterium]